MCSICYQTENFCVGKFPSPVQSLSAVVFGLSTSNRGLAQHCFFSSSSFCSSFLGTLAIYLLLQAQQKFGPAELWTPAAHLAKWHSIPPCRQARHGERFPRSEQLNPADAGDCQQGQKDKQRVEQFARRTSSLFSKMLVKEKIENNKQNPG